MALNGTQQSKLDQLRQVIKKELTKCNAAATPNICRLKATKKGYEELEKLIISRCIAGQQTPRNIVGILESELAE